MNEPFPARLSRADSKILCAHPAYRLADRLESRYGDLDFVQAIDRDGTLAQLPDASVLVISGLWRPEMLDQAKNLRFIQTCGAGYDRFDLAALAARGIALCNASGVNANAVSEHALALILAHTRLMPRNRDNQHKGFWHPMIDDPAQREDELSGKTLLIYGLGAIGRRLARLARACDMHVIGIKRDTSTHDGSAHEVRPPEDWLSLLPQADVVVLTCPLTEATRNLVDTSALAAMPPHCFLVNVARGGCVDEDALIAALQENRIAGAGLDTTATEPLPESSPLWTLENVILTPHTAGETRKYEDNLLALLLENLERLWRGETDLVNRQV